MFINSVSRNQGQVYFGRGQNPEILKNQFRILLTQDIWAPKLSVKFPETDVEKEVLLEVLQNRARLDRYTRLTNQKFELITTNNLVENLKKTNPNDKSLPELMERLKHYGNIGSTLETINKNITTEAKKNKNSLDYFKNIENLENEYLDKRIIKVPKIEKFWYQIKKNNINKDNQYSTKELIKIIEEGKAAENTNTAKTIAPEHLSKKSFIAKIEKQYEDFLRKNVDIYGEKEPKDEKALKEQALIYSSNIEGFKRYPEVQKSLQKIIDTVRNKYKFKVNRILGIDIYPIGDIFKDMYVVENDMKDVLKDIKLIKQELEKNPNDVNLKKSLEDAEKALDVHKQDWLMRLTYSMKYEQANRQRFADAGREADYSYLVDENIVLNKYKKAYKILEENKTLTNDELEAAIN